MRIDADSPDLALYDKAMTAAGYARLLTPHRRPYATQDGHLCVLIYNDKHWNAFIDAERPAWASALNRSALTSPSGENSVESSIALKYVIHIRV